MAFSRFPRVVLDGLSRRCVFPIVGFPRCFRFELASNNMKTFTSGPKIAIPKTLTLTDYIFDSIHTRRNRTAVVDFDTGESLTFGELLDDIDRVSSNLRHLGIGHGDVITYYGSNRVEIIHLLCACGRIGSILSLANAQLTTGELVMQLKLSSTEILFTTPECSNVAVEASRSLDLREGPYVTGEAEGCVSFSVLKSSVENRPVFDDVTPNDPLLLPFSSGTTGMPKGVLLSHYNLIAELHALRQPLYIPLSSHRDVSVCALPMVHIAGLVIGALNALSQGATTVLLHRFSFVAFMEALQRYRGTFALVAPPVMTMLAKDPVALNFDISSLTNLFSGAAPLDRTLTEIVSDRLNIDCIRQGYGMTETSPATHVSPMSGWKFGSIGLPLPNTECKIVDVHSKEQLGANEEGELWVRGPQVMLGYLDNEEANQNVFTEDGWLRTGDVGYFDSDGHYFICDRLKDIINYKGYQIPPAYLESVLLSSRNVQEAAVFGIDNQDCGELARAWVKLKDRKAMSLEEQQHQVRQLQAYVNERVAPYKRLRGGVRLVDEIPKSASGKLLRRVIQNMDRQYRDSSDI